MKQDLSGKVFANLKVRKCAGKDKHGNTLWECECLLCSKLCFVITHSLNSGNTQSCGCLRDKKAKERCTMMTALNTKHGHASNRRVSRSYSSWSSLIARCTNPKATGWKNYGGATPPVLVCDRWLQFKNFLEDMGERPEGTSLGRILDMGNYEPNANVFWMTSAEQGLARRNKYALAVWAESYGDTAASVPYVKFKTQTVITKRKAKYSQ